jgi:hypothetical protein
MRQMSMLGTGLLGRTRLAPLQPGSALTRADNCRIRNWFFYMNTLSRKSGKAATRSTMAPLNTGLDNANRRGMEMPRSRVGTQILRMYLVGQEPVFTGIDVLPHGQVIH